MGAFRLRCSKSSHEGNQTNGNTGTKENIDAGQAWKKIVPDQEYILLPLLTFDPSLFKSSKDSPDAGFKPSGEEEKIDFEHQENEDCEVPNTQEPRVNQEQDANVNSTNNINTVNPVVSVANIENNDVDENIVYGCIDDPNMPNLEEIVYSDDDEEVSAEANMNNLATNVLVSPIPTTRVHKDHPPEQIIRDIHSAPQTRRMTKNVTKHEPLKGISHALTDPSWIEAMQDELLQFKLQKVWTLVDLPHGKRAIVPDKVYKVEKDLYGVHQAPRAWYETLSTYLLENGFRRGTIDKTLFIKKDKDNDWIFDCTLKASRPRNNVCCLLLVKVPSYPNVHYLHAIMRILRYLKEVQPKLGLLVSRDSLFDLEAFFRLGIMLELGLLTRIYSNWRFVNFLQRGLFHGKSKKQLFLANSSTKAEYVAAANCCGQSSGPIPFITYETDIKEWEDKMERAATTASSLVAE
ncbi:putative ribonuclease H-like domain-containing protein [Tanacetum coccineum]